MKLIGTNIYCGTVDEKGTFTQFAYSKSCDIEISTDLQEVSGPDTGTSKEYIPIRKSWTMSVSCLLSDDETTVWNAFNNVEKILVSWRDAQKEYTGYAYIKSLKATANIHEMATFSITLQGTGDLTYKSWQS